jgi:hypothetical protein
MQQKLNFCVHEGGLNQGSGLHIFRDLKSFHPRFGNFLAGFGHIVPSVFCSRRFIQVSAIFSKKVAKTWTE